MSRWMVILGMGLGVSLGIASDAVQADRPRLPEKPSGDSPNGSTEQNQLINSGSSEAIAWIGGAVAVALLALLTGRWLKRRLAGRRAILLGGVVGFLYGGVGAGILLLLWAPRDSVGLMAIFLGLPYLLLGSVTGATAAASGTTRISLGHPE